MYLLLICPLPAMALVLLWTSIRGTLALIHPGIKVSNLLLHDTWIIYSNLTAVDILNWEEEIRSGSIHITSYDNSFQYLQVIRDSLCSLIDTRDKRLMHAFTRVSRSVSLIFVDDANNRNSICTGKTYPLSIQLRCKNLIVDHHAVLLNQMRLI